MAQLRTESLVVIVTWGKGYEDLLYRRAALPFLAPYLTLHYY